MLPGVNAQAGGPSPGAPLGTTPATERLLSDFAGTLREQLAEARTEAARLAAENEALRADLLQAKRELRRAPGLLTVPKGRRLPI